MRERALRLTVLLLAGAMIGGTLGVVGQAQSGSDSNVETVATFPSVGGTENICQTPDGSIYVTGQEDAVVWKVSSAGKVEKFASPPSVAMVYGVAPANDGLVITASERPFRRPVVAGQPPPQADFSDVGPQLLVLDKAGKVTATIPGPKGTFFNGITPARNGLYLIADTNNASILLWQFDLANKRLEPWLKEDALPAGASVRFRANGIKVHDGWVYVSIGGSIHRIQMDSNGRPKGMLTMFEKDVRTDDFDVAKDGTIYVSSGMTLYKISPTGQASKFRDNVQNGAATLVSRDGRWVYWPTRGGTAPQRLLRAAIQ